MSYRNASFIEHTLIEKQYRLILIMSISLKCLQKYGDYNGSIRKDVEKYFLDILRVFFFENINIAIIEQYYIFSNIGYKKANKSNIDQ